MFKVMGDSVCKNSKYFHFISALLLICIWISPLWADSVVVFNEIMYHPGPMQSTGEWIELHNQMAVDVDLSGWSIKGGIQYTFPEGTFLAGDDYLLIAEKCLQERCIECL